MESKQTLIFRLYQVLSGYSDADHPLTQQKIIDISATNTTLSSKERQSAATCPISKKWVLKSKATKKESILQAALLRTRNSDFLSTAF